MTMGTYCLMNKDNRICKFSLDVKVNIIEVYRNISFLKYLDTWIQGRVTPLGRKNINCLLKYASIRNEAELIKITRLISFNDCFWAKEVGDTTSWGEVSPYTNRLSKLIADVALLNDYKGGNLRSPSPEPATAGNYDKCWRRTSSGVYLVKSGYAKWSEMTGNESFSEVLVNQLEKALSLRSYVRYKCYTKEYDESTYVFTSCKLFTSENVGFVPVCDVFDNSVPATAMYKYYRSKGLLSALVLREMLLLDSLTLNFDRHTGNYGFLFDTNTLEIKCSAPIFDNNLALIPNTQIRGKSDHEILDSIRNFRPQTFAGTFIEQGRAILKLDDRENGDLRQRLTRARDFQFVRDKQLELLSDERLEFLNKLIRYQIKQILG